MAKVAQENNIELTFFHGKGGTVGRGGNPALYRAILSHPPNTINGRFRVTEQVRYLMIPPIHLFVFALLYLILRIFHLSTAVNTTLTTIIPHDTT